MCGKGKQGAGAGRGRKSRQDSTASSEREQDGSRLKQTPSQWFVEGSQALQLGKLTLLPFERGARNGSSSRKSGCHPT